MVTTLAPPVAARQPRRALDAGAIDDIYRGARYQVHATGSGVRPVFVAAMMEGMDRSSCPIPFPL